MGLLTGEHSGMNVWWFPSGLNKCSAVSSAMASTEPRYHVFFPGECKSPRHILSGLWALILSPRELASVAGSPGTLSGSSMGEAGKDTRILSELELWSLLNMLVLVTVPDTPVGLGSVICRVGWFRHCKYIRIFDEIELWIHNSSSKSFYELPAGFLLSATCLSETHGEATVFFKERRLLDSFGRLWRWGVLLRELWHCPWR